MRRPIVLLLVLAITLPAAAAFRKPYFAGTKPGNWAKYEVKDLQNGHEYAMTYKRLSDANGKIGVEIKVEFPPSAPGGAMTSFTRYELPASFAWDRDAINMGRHASAVFSGIEGGEMMTLPPQALETMATEGSDYSAATFKSSETVEGKAADVYTYSFKAPSGSTDTGQLWLSDRVPFGLVKQTSTMKDAAGATIAKMEYRLVATGTDGSHPAPAVAAKPPAAQTGVLSLEDALMKELVTADVAVLADQRLEITLQNSTDQPVRIRLPKGSVKMKVSDPIGTLQFAVAEEMTVVVPAGASADTLALVQSGASGPVEGTFHLSAYEGRPLFRGSVTMGTLKKN